MEKTNKYFISFSYTIGFGNFVMDSEPLTKENADNWISDLRKLIVYDNPKLDDIVILNIVEVR